MSTEIKSEYGSYKSSQNFLPASELFLIKMVKKNILDNGLHFALRETATVSEINNEPVYIQYSKLLKPGFHVDTNIYYIDLNAAYWVTAYKAGLLTDEIFKLGMDQARISKKTRLAAIGSLAKKTTTYEFDGTDIKMVGYEKLDTDFVWNVIAYRIGVALQAAAKVAGDKFLFFWVDGIYVIGKQAANKVVAHFDKKGWKSKIELMPELWVTKKQILLRCNEQKWRIINGEKVLTDIKPFHFKPK